MVHVNLSLDQKDIGDRQAQNCGRKTGEQSDRKQNARDDGHVKMQSDPNSGPELDPLEPGILKEKIWPQENQLVQWQLLTAIADGLNVGQCPKNDCDANCKTHDREDQRIDLVITSFLELA